MSCPLVAWKIRCHAAKLEVATTPVHFDLGARWRTMWSMWYHVVKINSEFPNTMHMMIILQFWRLHFNPFVKDTTVPNIKIGVDQKMRTLYPAYKRHLIWEITTIPRCVFLIKGFSCIRNAHLFKCVITWKQEPSYCTWHGSYVAFSF